MAKPPIPKTETVTMALVDLAPADYNPRRISPKAMQGLRASLARFGELGGIVWNRQSKHLVGGHQRVKALLALGETEAEVRVVDLDPANEKAANVALNHSGLGGEWDEALLAAVLDEVRRDLPITFDDLQLGDLIGPLPIGDESEPKSDQSVVQIWAVLIECEDEAAQESMLARLLDQGIQCRAL